VSNNINILFFGLGSIGQRHLRNLKKLLGNKVKFFAYRKTRHVPLLNNNGDKIKGTIEKKYKVSLINNLKSLKKYNIDLVFITNPSSLHLDTVLKLKGIKKSYIFIEKPIDASLKKRKLFINYIKKNKMQIYVGYNIRFHPCYIKLQNLLKEKIFKKINYTIFKCSENIQNNHSYEDYRISYAARKGLGGGVCLTNIHEIDMMLNLFKNTKLITSHKEKISSLKINVEDFSSSIFSNIFNGKKLVSLIILDFFQINKERYIKIVGEDGEIYLDFNRYFLQLTKKNMAKNFNFRKDKNLMYINELKLFLSFFKNRKKIPYQYSEKNAFKSLELALRIKK